MFACKLIGARFTDWYLLSNMDVAWCVAFRRARSTPCADVRVVLPVGSLSTDHAKWALGLGLPMIVLYAIGIPALVPAAAPSWLHRLSALPHASSLPHCPLRRASGS